MSALRYDAGFLLDIQRIEQHLRAHDAADIPGRVAEIFEALKLLALHPLIGRDAGGGRRQLVIGRGSRGYVALYRYDMLDDEVLVLALRAQREVGFDER